MRSFGFIRLLFAGLTIGFAKVTGPLMSLSASGSIAKSLTYGSIYGIQWVREWFKPANPQSTKQTNVRTAFNLAVEEYRDTLTEAQKDAYDVGAEGKDLNGRNLYMQRAMDEYIDQIGSDTTPTSVVTTGNYPDETIVWSSS